MKVEECYQLLANISLSPIEDDNWDLICLEVEIGDTFTSNAVWYEVGGVKKYPKFPLSTPAANDLEKVALFLKEDILHTTGERIWGMTFILNSDNKFDLKYSYDKPDWLKD